MLALSMLLIPLTGIGLPTPPSHHAALKRESGRPIAMAAAVRRACIFVMNQAEPNSHPLFTFCELPPSSTNGTDWLALKKAQVPDPRVIQATADSLDPAVWTRERGAVQGFEPPGGGVAAAALGGLPSTSTLLWGTTNFLVKRGREQLEVSVVARVGQRVCAANTFGPLLPATCELVLPDLDDGASATIPGAAALREAVRHDLHALPGSAANMAIRARTIWPDSTIADAAQVARSAGYFVGALLDGADPFNAFVAVAKTPTIVAANVPFSERATPATVNLRILASILSTLEPDSAARATNWPKGTDGVRLAHFYASKALLANVVHGAPYAWTTSAIPDTLCGRGSPLPCGAILAAAGRIPAFLSIADTARARSLRFAAARGDSARVIAAANMMSSATDLLATVVDLGGDRSGFERVTMSLHGLADITKNLATQDYSAAVRQSLELVDTLGLGDALPKEAARIFSLATDVAESDDAEGIEKALDHFVGRTTFMTKRAPHTGWHVFLNAYAGAALGREGACKGARSCGQTSTFAGAYAPIGIEVGHAVDWRGLSWLVHSAGLFVQAVDLGTLASWRLENDTDIESAPTVGGRQVLAPGAHIVLGIRSLPISVGIGSSLAPRLRRIRSGSQTEERNAVRPLSVFAAVDIPLYP